VVNSFVDESITMPFKPGRQHPSVTAMLKSAGTKRSKRRPKDFIAVGSATKQSALFFKEVSINEYSDDDCGLLSLVGNSCMRMLSDNPFAGGTKVPPRPPPTQILYTPPFSEAKEALT